VNAKEIYQNVTRLAKEHIEKRTILGLEIDYHLEVQNDGDRSQLDYALAVFDAECFLENNRMAKELREARLFLIAAGYYRVMPAEEIQRTCVSRGNVWTFKLGGVAYTSDYPTCQINEEGAL